MFFEIMLLFCPRDLLNLTKERFAIKKDGDGIEYIESVRQIIKNHWDMSRKEALHMQPVKKLSKRLKTFLQQLKLSLPVYGMWYVARVLGVKSIENMMRCISMDAN